MLDPTEVRELSEFELGRQSLLLEFEELAAAEERKGGDGRALRTIKRLAEMAGYGRKNVRENG